MGISRLKLAAQIIGGKIGGAVGTRASIGLLANAEKIEAETLKLLHLTQINAPTQITNQEELANYYSQLILCFGTLADLANDLRQLQRTEIAEVFEGTTERQVGSSTMPQKRNPIGWENIISQYKATLPRLITSYLNLISEHQRDLTDSAANRYLLAEILNSFLYSVRRVSSLLQKLEVNTERMRSNFNANETFELAEPAYILLAQSGVANAHEVIKQIARQARQDGVLFKDALLSNETFRRCFRSLSGEQKQIFEDSSKYIGRAVLATEAVCRYWKRKIKEIRVT
jgi:adenylosuccinate lyase